MSYKIRAPLAIKNMAIVKVSAFKFKQSKAGEQYMTLTLTVIEAPKRIQAVTIADESYSSYLGMTLNHNVFGVEGLKLLQDRLLCGKQNNTPAEFLKALKGSKACIRVIRTGDSENIEFLNILQIVEDAIKVLTLSLSTQGRILVEDLEELGLYAEDTDIEEKTVAETEENIQVFRDMLEWFKR